MQAIASDPSSANLVELFSSIQGEGILVGNRQIFLRFPGCNLKCNYCDTEHNALKTCEIETTPGLRDFRKVQNPVSLATVIDLLTAWKNQWPFLHHSLSITGGEPLLHSELLVEWLPNLRALFPIYLETNGLFFEQLISIIDYVDIISMDIKLQSTSGHSGLRRNHSEFLKVAVTKQCYVKVVVGIETGNDEVGEAAQLIAAIKQDIPLIIQPVTKQLSNRKIGAHLLQLQQAATAFLKDVRVIPQTHAIINVQ
ncbi:7-carboxy-7-deazaguanine synthase QueE [Geobacter sp. OR-1]|uniref:7-carboxy-7-deazaguanine synthase QueE n=1 Tax=Geobacter sp. OR-1 TaxID=1266765 RepID=UPI000B02D194|nr:7-carboxy-7-deazaguanine synthase QueE [Geobacter sp. OR-1]